MPAIQVSILLGSQTGKRVLLTESDSPVTFGRDVDNRIILDDPRVSRHHGRLILEGDQWRVESLSSNGVRVGWRSAGKKGLRLRDGDTLKVGEVDLLGVGLHSGGGPRAAEDQDDEDWEDGDQEGPAKKGKRSNLWLFVGIYVLVIVGIFIVIGQVLDRGEPGPPDIQRQQLTATDIENLVRRRLTEDEMYPFNQQRGDQALAEALEHALAVDIQPERLFPAYRSFREALRHYRRDSYLGLPDPDHRTVYLEVERRLTERIITLYQRGLDAHRTNDFVAADRAFSRVLEVFQDPSSDLFRNAVYFRNLARQRGGLNR
ncbi:MAG: FHA domain-containing protein [Phycisphaeraceae bacterium]|nr:FHA domain-containing protein [Phycisphaeraceae bacterium]